MKTTRQEIFWQGKFGDEYTERNKDAHWIASNTAFFSKVLAKTFGVKTILELGSNIGLNLSAIKQLLPQAEITAVEINDKAAKELMKNLPDIQVVNSSIMDFQPSGTWDLTFTKGVLIHIAPEMLPKVY